MSNTVIIVENPSNEFILSHQSHEKYPALRDGVFNGVKRLGKRLISFLRRASTHLGTSRSRQAFTPGNSKVTLGAKGFTMVELAVVLVILGTIFMSVLKIESMVKNAKIRQVINQYRELRTAILVYKDKYGYLPGDDKYASTHLGATAKNGDGDSYIYEGSSPPAEYYVVFEDLSLAGLISGKYTHTATAGDLGKHVFNGPVLFAVHFISGIKYNFIRFDNLPGDVAQAIDTALDDGLYDSGIVQGGKLEKNADNTYKLIPTIYSATPLTPNTLIKTE